VNILVPLLDHTSLKYLRETCQTLNETVRRNSNFLDRTLIIIEPGESDNHLNGLEMLGKNLILQIDDWKEKDDDFQKILNLLPSVESLEVRVDDPENIVVVEFIRLILAGSGLKELVIRQNVIPVYDSDELRPFVNQQSTIWVSIFSHSKKIEEAFYVLAFTSLSLLISFVEQYQEVEIPPLGHVHHGISKSEHIHERCI